MMAFKAVSPEKRRLDTKLSLAVGCGALLLFLITLAPGVFPGESAIWVAKSYGLEERGLPVRPLFVWITDIWASLPVLGMGVRMNVLSMLCATAAVVMLYRLVSFFVYEVIYEEHASAYAERLSWMSGVLAVIAAGTSVPLWQAATRLHYESFDFFLLMGCASLLMLYARTRLVVLPYVFAFVYGVCVPESPLLISFAPIFIFAAVITLWKNEHLSVSHVGWMGVCASIGITAVYWFSAKLYFQSAAGQAEGYTRVFSVMADVWRLHYQQMRGLLPGDKWIVMLSLAAAPWLTAVLAAPRALNNERSWSFYFLHFVMTVLVICSLLNVPMSPWGFYRTRAGLPVLSSVMVGMLTAYLCAVWLMLWKAQAPKRMETTISPLKLIVGHWLGRILLWPLLAAVVVAGVRNSAEAHGRRGMFADQFAATALDQMGEREWMVTDGLFDAHLLMAAHMRGQPLFLIGLHKDNNKAYQQKLKKAVERAGLFAGSDLIRISNTIDLGVLPFIQDWFATAPDIGKKVAVFGVPDLWYGAGLNPVSEFLFFGGKRDVATIHPAELLPAYLAFWDDADRYLPPVDRPEEERDFVERYRSHLRRHIGFLGNNLGVLFEELGADEEAYTIYLRMRQFDPQNVSVLFNQFEMIRRGVHAEDRAAVEQEMQDYVAHLKHRYSLWSLARYYGYVRSPELFSRLGWSWAMSGQMGAGLAGIRRAMDLLKDTDRDALLATMASMYAMTDDREKSAEIYHELLRKDPENRQAMLSLARLAIQGGELDAARTWMEKARDLGVVSGMSMGLEFAALHLASGNLNDARLLLQQVTDSQPQNLQAWAMLCVVQIQQNEVGEVETVILPRMIKTCGTVDNYYVQVTRAQVAMKKGKNFYNEARDGFIRAAVLRPDVPGVKDMILQLDIWLNDQVRAELHARQVLRLNRNHALANYVMGHLRLNLRQYGEAEDFLRRSVAAEPTLAALNDYAECLRRMKRYDEAERVARQAVDKNQEMYVVWETLASILTEQGKLDEAEQALQKALSLDDTDLRVTVSMARLQLRKGDVERARVLVGIIRKRQSELPDYDLERLQELLTELSKR